MPIHQPAIRCLCAAAFRPISHARPPDIAGIPGVRPLLAPAGPPRISIPKVLRAPFEPVASYPSPSPSEVQRPHPKYPALGRAAASNAHHPVRPAVPNDGRSQRATTSQASALQSLRPRAHPSEVQRHHPGYPASRRAAAPNAHHLLLPAVPNDSRSQRAASGQASARRSFQPWERRVPWGSGLGSLPLPSECLSPGPGSPP